MSKYVSVSCPDLASPSDGERRFSGDDVDGNFWPEFTQESIHGRYWPCTKVTYSCDQGYTTDHGWHQRICQETGEWDGYPLVCREGNEI